MEPVRPRHSKGSPSYDRLTRTILYLTLCPSGNAIVIELSQYWILVLPASSTAQVSAPVVATTTPALACDTTSLPRACGPNCNRTVIVSAAAIPIGLRYRPRRTGTSGTSAPERQTSTTGVNDWTYKSDGAPEGGAGGGRSANLTIGAGFGAGTGKAGVEAGGGVGAGGIEGLGIGVSVGVTVGDGEANAAGVDVGFGVGLGVGIGGGVGEGGIEGLGIGVSVGATVGDGVADAAGADVGFGVGLGVGVGTGLGRTIGVGLGSAKSSIWTSPIG